MTADDRRRKIAPHGTRARYNHRTDPCRCAACREANAAYQRRTRDNTRARPVAGVAPVLNKAGKIVGHQHPLGDW